MSLIELVDNQRTDKNTLHSYLPLYEELLHDKKTQHNMSWKSVLEMAIKG